MTKRTYNPEDYQPETQAAMKEIYLQNLAAFDWTASDQVLVADIIEKAVLAAKQVTEETVRAGCAAVAEVHLSKKGDPK